MVVSPNKALACLKSFPFNEILKQNVLTNITRIFSSFSFVEYYLNASPPFYESTVDIRAEITRINATTYEVSSLQWFTMWADNCPSRTTISIETCTTSLSS